MNSNTWLTNLKTGDTVIIVATDFRGTHSVGKVEHATPTQIVVKGNRYSRETGRLRGHDNRRGSGWILEATAERLAACQRIELIGEVERIACKVNLEKLPTETLVAVARLLKPVAKSKEQEQSL